jgi:hypothetical protein
MCEAFKWFQETAERFLAPSGLQDRVNLWRHSHMARLQITSSSVSRTEPQPSRAAGRSRRVILLIIGIVVLSVADLLVTVAFAKAGGMMEANPIALFVAKFTQSPWALAAYKFLTVGVCVAVLFFLRRYATCEVAGWCCVGILAVMSVVWHHYSNTLGNPEELMLAQLHTPASQWMVFE